MKFGNHTAMSALFAVLMLVALAPAVQADKDAPTTPLSDAQMAELHKQAGPESSDARMQSRLREIVERIKPYMRHSKIAAAIKPHVFDNPSLNAFAIPDGTLVVLSGLMVATEGKDDMLVATVAHELAHIDCQHGRPNATGPIIDILTTAAAALTGTDLVKIVGVWLKADRDQKQEFEADRLGMEYMLRAGYLPDGALRLQKEFTTRFGSGLGIASYFQTHPPGPARIRALQRAVPQDLLEFGAEMARVWRPRTGVVLAGDFQCNGLDTQLIEKMNNSAQMQAQLLTLAGEATPQAALAEAENQGLDLLLWCEPAPPPEPKKPALGVNLTVYDVPTGLTLLEKFVPRVKKTLTTPDALALALLSNRNWQCGGAPSISQVPLASKNTTAADVRETMAVVRFEHNAVPEMVATMAASKDVKTRTAQTAEQTTTTPSTSQAGHAKPGEKPSDDGSRPPQPPICLGVAYRDRASGKYLLPMKPVLQAFQGRISVLGKERFELTLGDSKVTIVIRSTRMETPTGPAKLSVAPRYVGDRGMVPPEVLMFLGMTVEQAGDNIHIEYLGQKAVLTLPR